MKKKWLMITTLCLAIALCVAAIGFTFAWYTNRTGAGTDMILNADGVLVVYVDEESKDGTAIKPAVAKPDAIRNNVTQFDVVNGDENIVETAKVCTVESVFGYMNATAEDGGSKPAEMTMHCSAEMVFSDGREPMELSLVYDLGVEIVEAKGMYSATGEEFSVSDIEWDKPFTVNGSFEITLTIRVYFLQPDELCTPYLLDAEKIEIHISMAALDDQ